MAEYLGGAPLLGEPLPIELANTTYAVRGRPQDGLETCEHLETWLLEKHLDADGITTGDLTAARELRTTIRAISTAIVNGGKPSSDAVGALNGFVAATPRWRELHELRAVSRTNARPTVASLAEIAAAAVELFGGPMRDQLRACGGPGCVLFFVKDRPRREWCSDGCGNRARAARHYAKIRDVTD
ncbi:ABATE domain-containing protein [Antrihabitans sp. YC2-6]|uniref:CGNR zinc finger domain-containing protein n=1 Tax=Antrihabitans sp. YC2-6 TaxID=2799498 RepID=UPI0018F4F4E3|nr:ABATE domain-containing protein [Antrihabitans sp. YC2-6]MBJ8347585.1 ABATE domain-containing protein [Antrihabitans sp. YC2-6]